MSTSDATPDDSLLDRCTDKLLSIQDFLSPTRLDGLNDAVCTYPEGYIRQEVFACLTCYAKTGKLAGICFGCFNECHADHELLELYTKRNFSCDCPTDKFTQQCTLVDGVKPENKMNKYTDNYLNKFCNCKLPYPPPKDTPEYDNPMYQCVVCEDWFHAMHSIDGANYDEIVCKECVTRLPFLLAYDNYPVEERPTEGCLIANRKAQMEEEPRCLGFEDGKAFRDGLCKCVNCMNLYTDNDCEFLTNYDESVIKYHLDREKRVPAVDPVSEVSDMLRNKYGEEIAAEVRQHLNVFKCLLSNEIKSIPATGVFTDANAKRVIDRMDELTAKRRRLDEPPRDPPSPGSEGK